jgi:hypothetical protein
LSPRRQRRTSTVAAAFMPRTPARRHRDTASRLRRGRERWRLRAGRRANATIRGHCVLRGGRMGAIRTPRLRSRVRRPRHIQHTRAPPVRPARTRWQSFLCGAREIKFHGRCHLDPCEAPAGFRTVSS